MLHVLPAKIAKEIGIDRSSQVVSSSETGGIRVRRDLMPKETSEEIVMDCGEVANCSVPAKNNPITDLQKEMRRIVWEKTAKNPTVKVAPEIDCSAREASQSSPDVSKHRMGPASL